MAKPGTPGAAAAIAERRGRRAKRFDADKRAAERNDTPVTIGGLELKRRKKDWTVSRAMRRTMRDQEREHALSIRVRARVAELEVEQMEAAAAGDDAREEELEQKIDALVARSDAATEAAELVTYRLLALLLKPPAAIDAGAYDAFELTDDDDDPIALEDFLAAFGPDPASGPGPAVAWLQAELDVEDAADLVAELHGGDEEQEADDPDPQTRSSATTS